jgi:hypothetical protein
MSFIQNVYRFEQIVNQQPLCPGFDAQARQESKAWLETRKKKSSWGKLTPAEQIIISQFGSKIESIIRNVMRRWNRAMQEKIRTDREFRRIGQFQHVTLILQYLQDFNRQYEEAFGYIEEKKNSDLGVVQDGTVIITSTGYGAKLVLGLMMGDRVQVAREIRKQERYLIGLLEVDHTGLKEDEKHCPICQDEMGVENLDGVKETCVEMAVCCGQYFGEICLKTWFSEYSNDGSTKTTCPYCRSNVPQPLLYKFLGWDDDESDGNDTDDNDPAQLIALDYQQFVNLLNPSSSPQRQLDPDQESQVEVAIEAAAGVPMEIDNDDFQMEG